MRATHLNKLVIYESLLITSTSHTAVNACSEFRFSHVEKCRRVVKEKQKVLSKMLRCSAYNNDLRIVTLTRRVSRNSILPQIQ